MLDIVRDCLYLLPVKFKVVPIIVIDDVLQSP